jgi:hypothetical protein
VTGITVVIPSIPPRGALLTRAVASAMAQTLQPQAFSIAIDTGRQGAGPTRTRALMAASTEWVAFLDDDDEMMPHHLETLHGLAVETGADVVYPWFTVEGGGDPLSCNRGKNWNPGSPHQFPITTLVRTELAQQVGGFTVAHPSGEISGEDFPFFLALSDAGARFAQTPEATWIWHHDSGNTSGLPTRW